MFGEVIFAEEGEVGVDVFTIEESGVVLSRDSEFDVVGIRVATQRAVVGRDEM